MIGQVLDAGLGRLALQRGGDLVRDERQHLPVRFRETDGGVVALHHQHAERAPLLLQGHAQPVDGRAAHHLHFPALHHVREDGGRGQEGLARAQDVVGQGLGFLGLGGRGVRLVHEVREAHRRFLLVADGDVEVPRVHELADDAVDRDVQAFHVLDGRGGVRDAIEGGLQALRPLGVRDVTELGGEERLALHVRARDGDLGRDVRAVGAAGRDLHALAEDGTAAGGEVAGQGAAPRMLVRGRGEGLRDGLARHLREIRLVRTEQLQHGRLEGLAFAQRGFPLCPFRGEGARVHRDAGPRPRRRARFDEGADRLPRFPAQDQEPDAAPRPPFLSHHLAQGLQLSFVGGQAEAEVELGAHLERDRRFEEQPVDADVEGVALDDVPLLGDS